MTSVIEARQRLDKTLASSALSDTAILSNLVRKQLLKSSAGNSATQFLILVVKLLQLSVGTFENVLYHHQVKVV